MSNDSLALDFKSANLYALRVVLHDADIGKLVEALEKRMAEAGSFFENEPVIIDASRLPEGASVDWQALIDALREHKLPTIGVVAEGALGEAAMQAGLTPVELSAAVARPVPVQANPADAPRPTQAEGAAKENGKKAAPDQPAEVQAEAEPAAAADSPAAQPPASPDALPAMVVTRPLRSGQRIYARHTDLVVVGMVSQGAEVIADGNIHVYGPLRGKAMAGARGDATARIFSTQLDPELLAIAGIYRVVENRLDVSVHGRPAQVRLEDETLKIEAL